MRRISFCGSASSSHLPKSPVSGRFVAYSAIVRKQRKGGRSSRGTNRPGIPDLFHDVNLIITEPEYSFPADSLGRSCSGVAADRELFCVNQLLISRKTSKAQLPENGKMRRTSIWGYPTAPQGAQRLQARSECCTRDMGKHGGLFGRGPGSLLRQPLHANSLRCFHVCTFDHEKQLTGTYAQVGVCLK